MRNCIFIFLILFGGSLKSQKVTITVWKDSAMGALYNRATHMVVFNKPNKNGNYKIYTSDSLGNNVKPVRYKGWREDRHQWAEEWHPSGKYIFCYVEKEEYVKEKNHKRKPVDAVPGYGAYTDLWLVSVDGSRAWQLTNVPNAYSSGIIHSAISEDGTMFGWSERVKAPKFLDKNLGAGVYVFKVADFVFDSIPRFTNIHTYKPGDVDALNEMDAISKDKTTIAFYSTFKCKNIITTPIYTLNMLTGEIKELTNKSFAQAPTYTPDGKHLIYMTGDECDIFLGQLQGADWWIMDTDGANKKRITYMNKRNHAQSVNRYRLCGSISFMHNNTFLGGVMTRSFGLVGYTVKVTFEE
jgi:Tol biopolymer transport system component